MRVLLQQFLFFITRDAFEFSRSECTQLCAVSAHIPCFICYKYAYCYGVKVVPFFYQFVLLDITELTVNTFLPQNPFSNDCLASYTSPCLFVTPLDPRPPVCTSSIATWSVHLLLQAKCSNPFSIIIDLKFLTYFIVYFVSLYIQFYSFRFQSSFVCVIPCLSQQIFL